MEPSSVHCASRYFAFDGSSVASLKNSRLRRRCSSQPQLVFWSLRFLRVAFHGALAKLPGSLSLMSTEIVVGLSVSAAVALGFVLGRLSAPLRKFTRRELEAHLAALGPGELSRLVRYLEKRWTISSTPPKVTVVRQATEDEKAAQPGATDNPDDAQRLREDH